MVQKKQKALGFWASLLKWRNLSKTKQDSLKLFRTLAFGILMKSKTTFQSDLNLSSMMAAWPSHSTAHHHHTLWDHLINIVKWQSLFTRTNQLNLQSSMPNLDSRSQNSLPKMLKTSPTLFSKDLQKGTSIVFGTDSIPLWLILIRRWLKEISKAPWSSKCSHLRFPCTCYSSRGNSMLNLILKMLCLFFNSPLQRKWLQWMPILSCLQWTHGELLTIWNSLIWVKSKQMT